MSEISPSRFQHAFSRLLQTALLIASMAVFLVTGAEASDFATKMMESTFKLAQPGDDVATCFLVRRDAPDPALYLVTVAHAFEGGTNETAVLTLRKGNPDGSIERHDYQLLIRREGKPLWVQHETHDVAVFRLLEPLPVSVSALPASVIASEASLKASGVHLGSSLLMLGYPLRLEAGECGIPIARQGIFASPPQLPFAKHPTYFVDANGYPGDSGGPVFIAGAGSQPLVVGIVLRRCWYEDKFKSLNEDRVIRNDLGIMVCLHAQYILDMLEVAARPSETPPK